MLERWLDGAEGALAPSGRCVVVGCGLGDDALLMARRGWRTTGFDFSPTAIGWAEERFSILDETLPGALAWRVADLHALPDDFHGAFDFAVEIYTFQALPPPTRSKSAAGFRKLMRAGGVMLFIARFHDDGAGVLPPEGPPWAVSMAELERHFLAPGLFELAAAPKIGPDPDEPERIRVTAVLRAR
jgi:SAM-dependent methyltransferase